MNTELTVHKSLKSFTTQDNINVTSLDSWNNTFSKLDVLSNYSDHSWNPVIFCLFQSQRHVTFHLPEGSQESSSDGGLGEHDTGSLPSTPHALPLGYPQEEYFDHAAPNNRTEGDGNSDPESSKWYLSSPAV